MLERTNDIITNPFSLPAERADAEDTCGFDRPIDTLDRFVYATIAIAAPRPAARLAADDLLSMLLAARDEQTARE